MMTLDNATKKRIKEQVSALFANGRTPASRYGIDVEAIERIEMANPCVTKQGVPHTHPLDKCVE